MGPYKVIGTPGSHSFTLKLPDQFCAIHPVFHISQLEPAELDPFPQRQQPIPLPVDIDGQLEYEINEILDSKLDRRFRPSKALRYLVKWAGYEGTTEEMSWVAAKDLENAPDLVQLFHTRWPQKPGPREETNITPESMQ